MNTTGDASTAFPRAIAYARGLVAVLATAAVGCATAHLSGTTQHEPFNVPGATFLLEYDAIDTTSVDDVKAALTAAVPPLAKWGSFAAPVQIRIQPSHAALEDAVSHYGYPWLRAWARYDSIDLQSPRTWSYGRAPRAQIWEVLTHELTHCLMYQRAATADSWAFKSLPLWFREGMASVTSHQEYRRPKDADVWTYLVAHPTKDPVLDGDVLYQGEPEIVYGAAHDAFAFLEHRYGDGAINALLDQMHAGADFGPAFQRAIGIDADTFAREYVRYVRWEGWRDER